MITMTPEVLLRHWKLKIIGQLICHNLTLPSHYFYAFIYTYLDLNRQQDYRYHLHHSGLYLLGYY